MKLLAVDTSTDVCSLCVTDGKQVVAEYVSRGPRTHTERLMPAIESLFAPLEWKITELNALAVIAGPGSFTGLRISLSVVKGLAFALQIPVFPASALEVAAQQVLANGLISPMMDARRKEIFTSLFEKQENSLHTVIPPKSVRPEAWKQELPAAGVSFCGPGTDIYFDVIHERKDRNIVFRDFILARTLAFLAHDRLAQGEGMSGNELKATYLRPSDAEIKGPRPPKTFVR